MQNVETAASGALGALTFGAFHQFTTNKIMEMNNELMNAKHNSEINKLTKEIEELRDIIKHRKRLFW